MVINEDTIKTTKTKTTKPKSLNDVIAKKNEKLKTDEKTSLAEQRRKEREENRKKRELITDDLEILMMCNAGNTELIYSSKSTGQEYRMTFGDTEWFTFKELKEMRNTNRGMLEGYFLIPIDVDSKELELKDILKALNIENLYEEDMLYEDNINFILNSLKLDDFERFLKAMNPKYVLRVVDVAIQQAVAGGFNDANKRSFLENLIKKPNMFKEAIDNRIN